eukprot:TRINITY_DN7822_c0_g1_i6.p1 TRINITY_DN7822_c0_g1~~TRINITY_DN7822_c0_g1_i6.p1  ORF type:complete len:268 (-),score=44.69 TRINITY_DN7822_c0_g1_i6:50-853(-)
MTLKILSVGALSVCLWTSEGSSLLRHRGAGHVEESFVRPLEFKHQLRVCNAFPYSGAFDVYKGLEKLTDDAPMNYKSCNDFSSLVKIGDKLDFKIGDATAGTFSVSYLPNFDAVLLLVVHLHDQRSTAVSFESHVFGSSPKAQIAVIDTYRGSAQTVPWIKDEAAANNSRSEELRFNSVVAVNSGKYEVELDAKDRVQKARRQLVALNEGRYVVLRTGVESVEGDSFPEDLMVFPESDPALLHSGATMLQASFSALVVAFSLGLYTM